MPREGRARAIAQVEMLTDLDWSIFRLLAVSWLVVTNGTTMYMLCQTIDACVSQANGRNKDVGWLMLGGYECSRRGWIIPCSLKLSKRCGVCLLCCELCWRP